MNELLTVILRTILVLTIVFILFKIMGKKQVSQMNMFDYITGITIGSIVADISLDIEKDIVAGITCLLIYCALAIIISYLSLKSVSLRTFLNGKEISLIENGVINRTNLSKNKITINILQTEARINGYFNLDEINNAILEPNGKISFEPKEKEKPVTKKDLGIKTNKSGLVFNLIIDGEIIEENLIKSKKSIKWLNHELKIMGKNKDDILLFTIDKENKINSYLK